jgi:hypothetical protein
MTVAATQPLTLEEFLKLPETKPASVNQAMTPPDHLFTLLPFETTTITFQGSDDHRMDCSFTAQITLEQYYTCDRHHLFNLKPELRGFLSNGEFQPDRPIQITAILQPDLLPQLAEFQTGEQVLAHLKNLAETQPDHPLLDTENWYALQVKQTLDDGETGYRTLWDYVNPVEVAQGKLSNADITDRLVQFFRDWMKANPSEFDQTSLENSLDEITKSFDQWLETSFAEGDRSITTAIDEATEAFDQLIEQLTDAVDELPDDQSIYETMIHFFTEDDWSFTKIQGEPLLRLGFQGDNGTWNCYAKAREAEQQFVFYSIYPAAIPAEKRSPISEFLTRANYGMTIGNFELDLNDGEIRYKTSIDVEGDRLSHALIKRLVYTNVAMMDEYLPGIKAVIETDITPEAAIRAIEQSEG